MELINDQEMGVICGARNATQAEHDAYRAWLRVEYGTGSLPPLVDNALFSKAWEMGHSNGYSEVSYFYGELTDLILLAYRTK